MGWADHIIEALREGRSVTFRPRGNSMAPRVLNGQLVTVNPDVSDVKKGSVVLCSVNGRQYLHMVKATRGDGSLLISNNKGRANGWTRSIYGVME